MSEYTKSQQSQFAKTLAIRKVTWYYFLVLNTELQNYSSVSKKKIHPLEKQKKKVTFFEKSLIPEGKNTQITEVTSGKVIVLFLHYQKFLKIFS